MNKTNSSLFQYNRREFLKRFLLAASSSLTVPAAFLNGEHKESRRFKKGDMYYRPLGRTGLLISEISIGGSPLPEEPLLLEAIERGVNYIDTSSSYSNGNSERQIGRLFKILGRDKIHVGTKFHLRENAWNEKSILKSVDSSLRRLGTGYVDVLLIHGARDEKLLTDERVMGAFEKLKKQGKYRYRGLSCHANHHMVVKEAVECGFYDMVMLGYNVFDIQDTEKEIKVYNDYLGKSGIRHLLALANSKGVGVIAMKTLKVGGKRQNLSKYKTGTTSVFQSMLKWVLEDRNISSVVTEMLTYEQLEEDLSVVGSSLFKKERQNLFRFVAENSKNYCHMCGLCQKACPSGIETTSILRFLIYYEGYEKTTQAKKAYKKLNPEQTLSHCLNCGLCEKACPYQVSIQQRLKEAHRLLS